MRFGQMTTARLILAIVSTSLEEVALWMTKRLEEDIYIYQETVVYEIEAKFGSEFVYTNRNGNPAIDRRVLREFRRLTENSVVWERGARLWRKREKYDPRGSRQVD